MQRCFTAHRRRIYAGAMLDQVQQDVHVTHERCHVQRRQTGLQPITGRTVTAMLVTSSSIETTINIIIT